MAQTCFPNDGLDGNQGHTGIDVLCELLVAAIEHYPPAKDTTVPPIDIHFGKQVPTGVGDTTIDITALKKLGDEQVTKLAQALGV